MDTANKPLEKWAFLLFAFAVALLPLGLGGNRPLPLGLLQLALAASAVLALCSGDMLKNIFWPRRIKIALLGIGLVIIWVVIQILPIVPVNWAHPLWLDTAVAIGKPVNATIALDHAASWRALSNLLTYVLVGLLAFIFGRTHENATRLLHIFFGVGSVIALYGFILYATSVQQVLWLPKWAHIKDLTGTFVNRNHFAVYAGMTLVCGFGLLWQQLRQMVKNVPTHQYSSVLQSYLLREGLWRILLCLMIMIAIILSHSRAGLVTSIAGLLLFSGCYLFYQKRYLLAFSIPALLGAGTIATLLTYGNHIGRFKYLFADYSSLDRLKVYTLTWDAITASPWLGYGFGNFETVFRLFRGENIYMNFNRAHSDWLESLFDLGLPMGFVLWASIALLFSGCLHGVRTRRQHGLYPAVALGAGAIVLLHAMVEFSLQMPGVVVMWVSLLGVGLAQSWSSQTQR